MRPLQGDTVRQGRVGPAHAGIVVDGLDAAYDGQVVLHDVSLRVCAGEMVGIIGPNGSGKSTLLRAIGGLLKPKRGTVQLDSEPLSEFSPAEIATRLSALPQAPPAPSGLTVRELVGYGRYPHLSWLSRFADQDRGVINRTITTCHLDTLAERPLATLSGGERQRAWIAMALAQQPQVMLLDEPVTFLDIGHQLEVMDLVQELNRSEAITVVAVFHDLNLAARYCPRLVAIKDGRIHSDGPVREVIRPEVLEAVFGIGARIEEDPITRQPVCYPFRLETGHAAVQHRRGSA